MEEVWERAVEAALEGQAESSSSSARTLTLDGAVKCLHGRLPPPSLLEKFQNLEHLSIANVGVSSLEKFPRLRNLQRLILSDNRIAGGLEFLVEAGLDSLRDLDLSNNRIQFLEDLAPLAQLRLVSLDLYECPVTRIKDYRSRVFGMIRSLKYLDKMDADENERPESDDEEEDDDEEEEDDEIDGDDPGSGEIDGEDRGRKAGNGVGGSGEGVGVVDVDEDEESDADEEESETGVRREANGSHRHHSNGFRVAAVGEEVDDEEDGEEEDVDDDDDDDDDYEEDDGDDDEMGEEIDADDVEDEDVVEVHDVGDSDEDEDGVQEEEDDDEVDDDGDDEEVEDEEEEGEPGSTGRLVSAEGEIDGHEHGEEDENENGEIGEADEQGVEVDQHLEDDDGDEEEDIDGEYLVQPIAQPGRGARGGSDAFDEDEEEVDDEDTTPSNGVPSQPSSSSQQQKRKRDDDGDLADDSDGEVQRSSKH